MYPTVSALFAALAAWLSTGTLALATEDGPRIALLPFPPLTITIVTAVAFAIFLIVRATGNAAPIVLLVLVLLPWLPLPVPASFLMWAGPLRSLVWLAVVWLLGADLLQRSRVGRWCRGLAATRPRAIAGALSLAIAGGAAAIAAPSVPGGDEPQYLVITQSLLLDGDLKIENNHRRGDYQQYFAGPLRPDYLQRGRDGEIYSVHAPGLSALIAPAFAAGGYRGVVVFLVLAAAAGGALLWHVGWLATRRADAAWFGWAAITFSCTWIFHAFTVYPDGVSGILALTGLWAVLRAREEQATGETRARAWFLHGAALALLPWLHTRFAVLAGSLGALILLRLWTTANPAGKAVAFLTVPALSAIGWIGYFIAIYGTPDPAAPYGEVREFAAAFIPGGLAGILFDQRFGLIANAPVLACAAFGFAFMIAGREGSGSDAPAIRNRRLAAEVLFVISTYLLTVTSYAMWWGGWSAPARFAAPALPLLVVALATARAGLLAPSARLLSTMALGLTAFISGVLVIIDRGRLAFNTREAYALWLDWASPTTDLGRGLPAWFRDREPQFFRDIAVWVIALTAAALVVRMLGRRSWMQRAGRLPVAAVLTLAVVTAAATTATWMLHRIAGTTAAPAQLQFLRALSGGGRALTFTLDPLARVQPGEALGMLRIGAAARYVVAGGAGRDDRPLLLLPAVPAGTYRVLPKTAGEGLLMIGIGADQFSLLTQPLTAPGAPFEITFPVDVRALIVRGDEDARRSVGEITVEPVKVMSPAQKVSPARARRAVKYPSAAVFFLDERSFPEPEGFWLGGARQTSVVVQPDPIRTAVRVVLRSAPVRNHVVVEAGAWRTDVDLAPGEERPIDIPLDPARGAALVRFTVSSGFRPSQVQPGSRDERFLGVWVQIE